jgi:hypothetical protein
MYPSDTHALPGLVLGGFTYLCGLVKTYEKICRCYVHIEGHPRDPLRTLASVA